MRRSVSSIQTSIRLAVATSRCSSHTLCASRSRAASVLLSSPAQRACRGLDVLGVVVEHALRPGNVADGPQRKSTDLSNSFRDRVGHREKLIGMFIE